MSVIGLQIRSFAVLFEGGASKLIDHGQDDDLRILIIADPQLTDRTSYTFARSGPSKNQTT
jgi:hypothetical protein